MMSLPNFLTAGLLGYSGFDDRGGYTLAYQERRRQYRYADALYDNTIYRRDFAESQRKEVFKECTGRDWRDESEFTGHINPIAGIVDAYQYAIRGRYGHELTLERDGQEMPADFVKEVGSIWRDSRLDLALEPYQHFGANFGTSFLRVVADGSKVRVLPWHPKKVVDLQENDAGAIAEILFEYSILTGPVNADRKVITYRERLTKDTFEKWDVADEKKTKQTLDNPLGFVPVVMVRHADKGREFDEDGHFGLPAWHGSDGPLHLVNVRHSQLGLATNKALWPKWFVAAAGTTPKEIPLDGENVVFCKLESGDGKPDMKALVEPINQVDALKQIDTLMTYLIARQPEMVLSHLESLSGQSGETIAKLLTPVTSRIMDARRKYEAGLKESIGQALSWKRLIAGESRLTIDAAYQNGELEFGFAPRPALPPTAAEIIQDAKAKYAERLEGINTAAAGVKVLPLEESLKAGGYSDADATKFAQAKEAADAAKQERALKSATPPNAA